MFPSRASCVAVLLLLAGPALAQDGGLIDRVQMGDNDLDCAQIAAQVKELEALLAPHSGDTGAVRGAAETVTRSRTGEVVAGVAKVLPFGSIFGDIAKDVLGRRGRDSEARIASARARKEYLVDMFLKRGCRVADVAAAVKPPASPGAAPDAKPAAGLSAHGSEPAGATPGAEVATAEPNAPQAGPQTAPDLPPAAQAASASGHEAAKEPVQHPAVPAPDAPAAKPAPEASPAGEPATPAAAPRGPLFMLDFRLAFRTRADADGPAGAPGLELGGVPLTTMQAITDAAYVALLKELRQAGFEVLNPELAAPVPTGGSLPAPARAGDYLYFAPSGAPLAQAPAAAVPGSDAALAETRAALAQAVAGRRPGVSYGIAVWYVDFARVSGAAGADQPRQLESRLAVAAGSHLALVEPAAGEATPPDAVRVMNLGRDLVSREPYGQVRLSGPAGALELKADPQRFRSLIERQLKRGRSALIASLPAPLPAPATAPSTEAATAPAMPPAAPAAAAPH
jgi:hypothetical protein